MVGAFPARDVKAENMFRENLLPVYFVKEKHSMAKLTNEGLMTLDASAGGVGGTLISRACEAVPVAANAQRVYLKLGISMDEDCK